MRDIQESIISMLREHSTRKHLAVAVCMIAIATAFAVFWSLRISGLTLASDEPACGMQEHTHTDACYDWVATVTDGTEEIESTDETETTEAVEKTDETETTEAAETTEAVEITEATETEEATDEAFAEAEENAEAYESASVEEDTSTAEETAAEAVTEETETETESVTKMSSEDATEEVAEEQTEEETEAPQPGDMKVVDGVTYVYELVCGLEEHSHTDECYESEASEVSETEDTDGADEDDETDEISLNDLNAGIATLSLDDEDGISVASDEDETSASSGEDYYFADSTTLADAAANQDESYIVYTKIGDSYYVVSADNTLVECKYVDTTTEGFDLATATASGGMYYWLDDAGNPEFKCTTSDSSDTFDNYRWTLSGTDANSGDYGSGSYTLYNSDNSVYIAPQDVGVSETISCSDGSRAATDYYTLGNNEMVIFVIECTKTYTSDNTDSFWVELQDSNGKWYTTTSEKSSWFWVSGGSVLGSYDASGSSITVASGTTYIVTVERKEVVSDDSEDPGSTYTYTVTYYNSNDVSSALLTYTATGTDIDGATTAGVQSVHGDYDVSVMYGVSKSVAGTTNDTSSVSKTDLALKGVTNDIVTDPSMTVTGTDNDGNETETTVSTRTGEVTLKGDFDITYSFYNYGNNSTSGASIKTDKENNFVLILQESSGGYVYVKPSFSAGAVNSNASVSVSGTEPGDWRTFGSQMNAGYETASRYTKCYVNVVREKNVVTVTITIVRNGNTSYESCTTAIYDSNISEVTVYLTAVNADLTGIDLEDSSTSYDVTGYDSYSAVGAWGTSVTLTGVSGGSLSLATATSKFLDNVTLAADSASSLRFVKSGASNTVFYLAKVREYSVFFDGQNGGTSTNALYGVIYYRDAEQKTLTTSADADGTLSVTIPTLSNTSRSGYVEYKLRGWVNIYTGDYYDIDTYYGKEVVVTENTVFYADWEVADYDIGQDVNTVEVPDTSNYIKTYLFDYNDIFNLYSAVLDTETAETSGSAYFVTSLSRTGHSERWSVNETSGTLGLLTNKTNLLTNSLGFVFLGAGTDGSLASVVGRDSSINKSSTASGNANEAYLGNIVDGIIGQEGTKVTDGTLLNILFSTTNTVDSLTDSQTVADAVLGKTYVGEGYNLFQYNKDTGYYYYDSTRNAAAYNQSAKTFYVYNYTEMTAASNRETENYTDFLPFNYSASSTSYDVYTVDYWFGMQTDIDFYLPDNSSSSGGVNQSNGNDMVFKFSGDDDVWVCVDDVLVLDLGGMHGAVYGEINFSTGTITIGQSGAAKTTDTKTDTISITGTTGVTTTSMDFSKGTHELTVYYLERGASQSNMAIYFNISPIYSVEMTKVGESAEELENVTFDLYSSSTFTDEYLVEKDITTNDNGYLRIDELAPLTTYYLVETSAASGYPLTSKYITIYVDSAGKATVTVHKRDGTTELEKLTCEAEGSVSAPSDYRYLLQTLSVDGTSDETYGRYYLVKFTYANYLEYELPATGSMGIFPYRRAGTVFVLVSIIGLLIIAFYHLVWVRKLHTSVSNKGYTEEKRKRGKRFARTRDHPRERSGVHGRDASVTFVDGETERSRGTGPGTE